MGRAPLPPQRPKLTEVRISIGAYIYACVYISVRALEMALPLTHPHKPTHFTHDIPIQHPAPLLFQATNQPSLCSCIWLLVSWGLGCTLEFVWDAQVHLQPIYSSALYTNFSRLPVAWYKDRKSCTHIPSLSSLAPPVGPCKYM
jgi:hypothetical protein